MWFFLATCGPSAIVKFNTHQRMATQRLAKSEWAKVDWTLNDRQIARVVGRSHQRVQQVRHALGKPIVPQKRGTRLPPAMLRKIDRSKRYTSVELARLWNMDRKRAWDRGMRLGVWRRMKPHEYSNRKYPWELMNFDLPNNDLVHIWRFAGTIKSAAVLVSIKRRSVGRKSRWTRCAGHQPTEAAYKRAYRAEVRRAERWRSNGAA
jgi:hypothetical protein